MGHFKDNFDLNNLLNPFFKLRDYFENFLLKLIVFSFLLNQTYTKHNLKKVNSQSNSKHQFRSREKERGWFLFSSGIHFSLVGSTFHQMLTFQLAFVKSIARCWINTLLTSQIEFFIGRLTLNYIIISVFLMYNMLLEWFYPTLLFFSFYIQMQWRISTRESEISPPMFPPHQGWTQKMELGVTNENY